MKFCLHHHYFLSLWSEILELWKGKLVHLPLSGRFDTTAPTVIQSITPIMHKMATITITMMCHHFISSKGVVVFKLTSQDKMLLHVLEYSSCVNSTCIQIIIEKVHQELSYMPTATIDLSFYCKEGGKEIFLNFQLLANKGNPSNFLYHLHKPR